MAVYALYIEKEVSYFGGVVVMGNTYHYLTAFGEPFRDAAVAEEVAEAEKTITTNEVAFVGWRTWGPTDGPIIDNIIRDAGPLSGVGFGAATQSMYREACALVTWPLERSAVLNRRRWLRKFIRLPSSPTGTFSSGVQSGQVAMTAAQQDAMVTSYANAVREVSIEGHELCTAAGDVPIGPAEVRPYLYTRQIGQ